MNAVTAVESTAIQTTISQAAANALNVGDPVAVASMPVRSARPMASTS